MFVTRCLLIRLHPAFRQHFKNQVVLCKSIKGYVKSDQENIVIRRFQVRPLSTKRSRP